MMIEPQSSLLGSVRTGEVPRRTILVTGGGSGIGAASARLVARDFTHIGLLDKDEAAARRVQEEIAAAGGSAEVIVADVSDEGQMRQAVSAFASRAGRLDGVIISAGINGVWAPIDDLRPEEFDHTLAINLRGTYLTLHFTVPHLKKAGGSIVIISSVNGVRTFSSPGASAYAASKAAQFALANQLALELARFQIRVNTVCPGHTKTGIGLTSRTRNQTEAEYPASYPLGKIPLTGGAPAEAVDVAEAVAFLMSERARHISGSPLFVDGAASILT